MNSIRFLDLFAGIGGFRLAFEMAGHECIGYVEWDKFARKSYEAIHDTKGEWTAHDITTVTDEEWRELHGTVDIVCGGFPCQAFSIAGKRRGFEDTRGTMFFEIARAAKQIQPRYLVLENVKGLLSHDKGNTFATILATLDELGYDAEWQVLNTKDFSTKEWPTPQNRERVFIVGHSRRYSRREIFPIEGANGEVDIPIEIIAHRKGYRRNTQVFSPNGITETLDTGQGGGRGHYTMQFIDLSAQEAKITDTSRCLQARYNKGYSHRKGENSGVLVAPVLTPDREEKRQNGRRFKEPGEPMFTLTAQDKHGIYDGFRIRKLTPRECFRLQGFPDWAFDKAQAVNSDRQLYKQAGNAVSVNVVYEIAKRLKE